MQESTRKHAGHVSAVGQSDRGTFVLERKTAAAFVISARFDKLNVSLHSCLGLWRPVGRGKGWRRAHQVRICLSVWAERLQCLWMAQLHWTFVPLVMQSVCLVELLVWQFSVAERFAFVNDTAHLCSTAYHPRHQLISIVPLPLVILFRMWNGRLYTSAKQYLP